MPEKFWREIVICKADPAGETLDTHIHITDTMAELHLIMPTNEMLENADVFFAYQAQILERALYASLPGGTYDRLLCSMLRRKASHFVVAHGKGENDDDSE